MRRLPWILLLVLSVSACGREDLHRRFQAERARYWAERSALRYSLEADPLVRRRYHRTGMAYLRVAQEADTTGLGARGDPRVLSELVDLRSWGLLRAGDAFLRSGRFDLGDEQLAKAQVEGSARTRAQAALLRAEAERAREEWGLALRRTREFHEILRAAPSADCLDTEVLGTPITLVEDLVAAGRDSLLLEARREGHHFYAWVQEQWSGQPCAERAAFLDHRIDLSAHDWEAALKGLDLYEARSLRPADRWNATFDRAEILAQGLGVYLPADSLYAEVAARAGDEGLRGLATLRRCEIAVLQGRPTDALRELKAVEKEFPNQTQIVASAIFRRAELQEQLGDWARAQRLFRRVIQRYPATEPGLQAPLRLVELHRRRGDQRGLRGALSHAEDQYQRLIAGHSSTSPVAVQARRKLVQCFLQEDKIQEALYELEQLHHILGGSLAGGEALLDAARVARDQLQDPRLARRYLRWVEREMPASRVGVRAREMLAEMEDSPPGAS